MEYLRGQSEEPLELDHLPLSHDRFEPAHKREPTAAKRFVDEVDFPPNVARPAGRRCPRSSGDSPPFPPLTETAGLLTAANAT